MEKIPKKLWLSFEDEYRGRDEGLLNIVRHEIERGKVTKSHAKRFLEKYGWGNSNDAGTPRDYKASNKKVKEVVPKNKFDDPETWGVFNLPKRVSKVAFTQPKYRQSGC